MTEVRHAQQRRIEQFVNKVKAELTPTEVCCMQVGFDHDADVWFAEVDGVRRVEVAARLMQGDA